MNTGTSRLKLNRRDARGLGVCAGIADWLDVPTALVRVIFVICAIFWPTLIIGYFLLYFCLDKDITPDKMRNYFKSDSTAEHFKQLNYRKPIYKNKRNKRIAGVCSGIADYFEVSAFAIRAVTLFSLFVFGPFTFWAYIICIFVFEADPHAPISARQERRARSKQRKAERRASRKNRKGYVNEAYAKATAAFKDATEQYATQEQEEQAEENSTDLHTRDECTEIYNTMELRLREIEAYMTSKRFRLHCEISRI